ncbi:unnamed protein product [Rotaria magnacalcarata]|uniref:Uncharacterized protein n=1 Tax=Rotaria magnacalcarata TaxID=392030 RepID=A0A819ZG08_9BILA|nr:unnamed protein product [Rotaria magnacalcarata]CAF3989170.1 unnamed protein product [Rotaria magnacalcarata]CAF4171761.1 unnamed protein product [Rotaria magnacalcarata]CAF4176930.1 unnamed protein product [Rotaria magnacalcarata]CAF4190421.1 unnamed protein product [Rotaria magnacalcarata]
MIVLFYLTQDTKSKVSIDPPSAKCQAPSIMHLDYENSSLEPQTTLIATHHQFTPCVYAASIINETGLIRTAGRTYVSIRSAKHDHLMQLKEFEKFSRDHFGSVKPIVVINVDTDSLENNTRYSKTLSAAIDKFKKYNLDALVIANQAPGQGLFNIVERCLPSTPHDLAELTEHAELEKENFKTTGNVITEVWSMNVFNGEYHVVAEYINPSPFTDDQLKMACVEEDEEAPLDQCVNQTRSISTVPKTEVKNECDID